MCGRFSFAPLQKIIEERFDVWVDKSNYKHRYNCSPTQNLAVITNENPRELSFYRWGLIPFWAKDKSIGARMINAKAETIDEKPAFRTAFKKRRCLVLADGFYEWKKTPSGKLPHRIILKSEAPFAMAGIWEQWKDESGSELRSFAIITTSPNEKVAEIHNRMPVIIPPQNEKDWLHGSDVQILKNLLKPYPAEDIDIYPVSKMVNSPANDTPELISRK